MRGVMSDGAPQSGTVIYLLIHARAQSSAAKVAHQTLSSCRPDDDTQPGRRQVQPFEEIDQSSPERRPSRTRARPCRSRLEIPGRRGTSSRGRTLTGHGGLRQPCAKGKTTPCVRGTARDRSSDHVDKSTWDLSKHVIKQVILLRLLVGT